MSYTLTEVWTPIRTTVATLIQTTYNETTGLTIDNNTATRIEALCYNYCHALMDCDMLFDDDTTLIELQTILKGAVKQKAYALVSQYNLILSALDSSKGKNKVQESYYDVADTPRIERAEFNEMDINVKQLDAIYLHSQAIKELYNDIKQLVQTIYY